MLNLGAKIVAGILIAMLIGGLGSLFFDVNPWVSGGLIAVPVIAFGGLIFSLAEAFSH